MGLVMEMHEDQSRQFDGAATDTCGGCVGAGMVMHDEHVKKNQSVSKTVHVEPLHGLKQKDRATIAGKLHWEHGGDVLSGGDDREGDPHSRFGLSTEENEREFDEKGL
ncbi:hypothetical protein Dsin_009227 [Dipteronia sinensis]|uniref:Uncharacterized protein n=1 Tax=Dipteronia sinensis TaxID=43782 RepID=A0AAE0EBX2_9ROSI|nr:hypothetical protein Dsin_009227 [Dipteronia sinensis]